MSLPVFNRDTKWEAEERNTVRQGKLTMVVQWIPDGRKGGGDGEGRGRSWGEGARENPGGERR